MLKCHPASVLNNFFCNCIYLNQSTKIHWHRNTFRIYRAYSSWWHSIFLASFKGPEKAFASNTLFLLYVYDTDHANAYAYTQKKDYRLNLKEAERIWQSNIQQSKEWHKECCFCQCYKRTDSYYMLSNSPYMNSGMQHVAIDAVPMDGGSEVLGSLKISLCENRRLKDTQNLKF